MEILACQICFSTNNLLPLCSQMHTAFDFCEHLIKTVVGCQTTVWIFCAAFVSHIKAPSMNVTFSYSFNYGIVVNSYALRSLSWVESWSRAYPGIGTRQDYTIDGRPVQTHPFTRKGNHQSNYLEVGRRRRAWGNLFGTTLPPVLPCCPYAIMIKQILTSMSIFIALYTDKYNRNGTAVNSTRWP